LALDRLRLPTGVPFFRIVASLVVPGLGFYLRGPRLWGMAAMAFAAQMALLFMVGLGDPVGNAGFGLLLSIHVSSVIYVLEPWLAGARFHVRLSFSFVMLFVLGALVYLPVRTLIQEQWLMPLRVKGRVVIVQRLAHLRRLPRGTWIAYTIEGLDRHGVNVQDGFGLGPVLALPGDRVRFTKSAMEVNGVSQPLLPYMPQIGEWVVPEKHWFVWPEVDITGHGNTPADAISATLLQMGTITEDRFVGRPFKRWFGRRQL
jgi:hypothetical protein